MMVALVVGALMQAPPPNKVDLVSVTGCLRAAADSWMLVNATDPVASNANAPAKSEIPATPPVGKNQVRLIGVSEFNLPALKDRVVIAKGLWIKAEPVSRLNITSVTPISATCPAAK